MSPLPADGPAPASPRSAPARAAPPGAAPARAAPPAPRSAAAPTEPAVGGAGSAGPGDDAELLALLLGGRAVRHGALPRARALLARAGSLRALAAAGALELERTGGLGRRAAERVAAAFALGRRAAAAPVRRGHPLTTTAQVHAAYGPLLRDLRKETLLALHLDAKGRVLREERVSEGTLQSSPAHPREVFGPALRHGAAALILLHNHPSGDPEPSPEDVATTRRLAAVGDLVGIRLLDHLVIGDGCYVSLLERGELGAP